MESLDFEDAKLIIKNVCKIVDCLHHISGDNVFISLLVSCRPHTYTVIKDEFVLDGWHSPDPITYEDPVSLSEVFKRKFRSVIKTDGEARLTSGTAVNLEQWNLALDSLFDAVDGLCDRRGDPICTVNNNDIRGALCSLVRVLKSPFWHNKNVEGAFSPDVSGRVQETQAMFIRALSVKDNGSGFHSDNSIFNIYQNSVNASTDLLYSFICSYLINTNESSVLRRDIEDALGMLFPKELVVTILDYEAKTKRARIIYSEYIDGDEYIVKLPSVSGLKDMISQSSVYTELMMSNVYVDENLYEKIKKIVPDSRKVVEERYSEKMLEVVLEYCSYIFQKESCLLMSGHQKNKMSTMYDYSNQFGGSLVSECVATSIKNSIDYYYSKNCSNEFIQKASVRLKDIENRVALFKSSYKKNFVINEKEVYFDSEILEYLVLQCGNVVYIGDLLDILGVEYFDLFRTALTVNSDINSKIMIVFLDSSKILISDAMGDKLSFPIPPEKIEAIENSFYMIRDILNRAIGDDLGLDEEISDALEVLQTGGHSRNESNEKIKGIFGKFRQQAENLSNEGAKAAVQTLIKSGVSQLIN